MGNLKSTTDISKFDSLKILDANQVSQDSLYEFLTSVYSKERAEFLERYSPWLFVEGKNRWVVLIGNAIAGYCAVIPGKIHLRGESIPIIWWVDLIVGSKYRGLGLQSLLDSKIRELDIIKFGIPNKTAAGIHLKHGWGVRDDLRVCLLPLYPMKVNHINDSEGIKKWLLIVLALGLSPIAWFWRKYLNQFTRWSSWSEVDPDIGKLSEIFDAYCPSNLITDWRDEQYFHHRFICAPYRSELKFYFAGPLDSPTHYLIARFLIRNGIKNVRVLDMFGDFNDLKGYKDLLKHLIQESVEWNAAQITCMCSLPGMNSLLRSLGFWIQQKTRFCWYPKECCRLEDSSTELWISLADSDNDSPD